MSLTHEDREWIKDMIAMVAAETLNASRDFTREELKSHFGSCPNVQRLRWMLIGMGIGLGASAPSMVKGVLQLWTA